MVKAIVQKRWLSVENVILELSEHSAMDVRMYPMTSVRYCSAVASEAQQMYLETVCHSV